MTQRVFDSEPHTWNLWLNCVGVYVCARVCVCVCVCVRMHVHVIYQTDIVIDY